MTNTGANSLTVTGTANLCLWINGMPSRTIYLVRHAQPQCVYFHFALDAAIQGTLPIPPGFNSQGFYFSTDPVGGGPQNGINGAYVNNLGQILTNGPNAVTPPIFPGTSIIFPGNTAFIRVDNSWPDTLFYHSTQGPYMGGKVIVVGRSQGPQ